MTQPFVIANHPEFRVIEDLFQSNALLDHSFPNGINHLMGEPDCRALDNVRALNAVNGVTNRLCLGFQAGRPKHVGIVKSCQVELERFDREPFERIVLFIPDVQIRSKPGELS